MTMMNHTHILAVDDDRNICELLRLYLEKEGFTVTLCYDGASALQKFKEVTPSLVLLDIMLPGMDGRDVCKEIRRISNIPVIMLTAKGETFDKVLGLELGADDYVVKPFEPRELVARIKAVLRRYEQKTGDAGRELIFQSLNINMDTYQLKVGGKLVELPPKELELLYFLAFNAGRVFTREQLLDEVWGYDFFGDSRTVDVHIKRLREKITLPNVNWNLTTVWGVGYKFEVSNEKHHQ